MLLRNIFEAIQRTGQGKTAVVGWGRGMGHKGHMMLASSVITQAGKVGGDPYFVVSKTVGKDDPITPDEKIAIYKKVFPQSGHIFQPATDEIPDLTRVLANLNQQGYTSVAVVLGADQVKAFQYLKNYNNKPDKSGNILYSFDNLDVISRQETGDPSAGEEGPRATPMRQVLMDPTKSEQEQFAVWRDAMNPEIGDDEVRDLMMKAKERMTAMSAPKPKKVKAVAEMDSQGYTGSRDHKSMSKYGSRDDYELGGPETTLGPSSIAKPKDVAKQGLSILHKSLDRALSKEKKASPAQVQRNKERWAKRQADKGVTEYGDTARGQKMLGKVQKRAVDRVVSKKADTDPKYAKKNQDTANAAWERMKDVGECAGVGVIASKKQAKDPRYSMSLTRDVRPGQVAKNMKAFSLEEETLSELSNELLGRYKKSAAADASAADKAGDTKRADKRFSGIVKATKKQFANDEKGVVEVTESEILFYAKLPNGQKVYARVKDEQQLADLQQEYRDADTKTFDFNRPDVQRWLETRRINMRKFTPGIVQTMGDQSVAEKMLPKSAFAGSDKNKLGPAAHAKGKQKGPVKRGQFVGGMEEEKQRLDPSCWKGYKKQGTKMKGGTRVNNCVKVSESVENIMDGLINKIITNEAIQNNRR